MGQNWLLVQVSPFCDYSAPEQEFVATVCVSFDLKVLQLLAYACTFDFIVLSLKYLSEIAYIPVLILYSRLYNFTNYMSS
jgi:hypothetical protein